MPDSDDELLLDHADADADATRDVRTVDRRRPGRADTVSSHLIPLLRQRVPREGSLEPDGDDLRAPTGLLVSAAVSAVIWAGILFGLRSFFFGG